MFGHDQGLLARTGTAGAMGGQALAGPIVPTGPVYASIAWETHAPGGRALLINFGRAEGLHWRPTQTCDVWPAPGGATGGCCTEATQVVRVAYFDSTDGISPAGVSADTAPTLQFSVGARLGQPPYSRPACALPPGQEPMNPADPYLRPEHSLKVPSLAPACLPKTLVAPTELRHMDPPRADSG